MTKKYNYQDKLSNIEDLKLNSNLLVLQANILEWSKAKPNNKKLKEVSTALVEVSLLAGKLTMDKATFHLALEDYRSTSLRATQKSRKLETKVSDLEKELKELKVKINLGL